VTVSCARPGSLAQDQLLNFLQDGLQTGRLGGDNFGFANVFVVWRGGQEKNENGSPSIYTMFLTLPRSFYFGFFEQVVFIFQQAQGFNFALPFNKIKGFFQINTIATYGLSAVLETA
jgi:hypothetical protein